MYIISVQKFTAAFYLVLTSDFGNFIARIASIILTFVATKFCFTDMMKNIILVGEDIFLE